MDNLFVIGKPSISLGHLYHGYVSQNQVGYISLGAQIRPSAYCLCFDCGCLATSRRVATASSATLGPQAFTENSGSMAGAKTW